MRNLRKQDDGGEGKAGGEIQNLTGPTASLAFCSSLSTLFLPPAGLTSTSPSTRASLLSPPEISTDLAVIAMVLGMTVETACCWVSEEAQASEGELG